MRILQIAPPWCSVPPTTYGGSEAVVSALAEGLVDAGHEVVLVASGGSRTTGDLRVVFDEPPLGMLGDAKIEATQSLAGHLLRDEVDLVHDHTSVGPALAALADDTPVVTTLHSDWTPGTSALLTLVARRVALVAISHDQRSRAPTGLDVPFVVHHGLRLERFPFRSAKEDFLLFVGRASPDKGITTAIDVAARLGRRLIMAVKVNEPAERHYWTEVVAPRITRDVEVRWSVAPDERADLMGRASTVLMPIAWHEPFGLVMVEAMACGTPVVAFAIGAAPELIADGTTGHVVPPGDVDAFTAAVESCEALDPAACRRHVEEHFTAARMVDDYLHVYERVLRGEATR